MLHEPRLGTVSIIVGLWLVLTALYLSTPVLAAEEHFIDGGYGISGYDPVSYFMKSGPVEGNAAYAAEHEGVMYRFSTASNRERFLRDPQAYVPAYGGFCAFGTAMGRKFPGDPNAWKIVDGTLYLNLNKDIQKTWLEDVSGFIKGANRNWPIIRSVADASLESSPPINISLGAQ